MNVESVEFEVRMTIFSGIWRWRW